jgi:transposase-like protein
MAQHFLLSAAARTLSLRSIYEAGEESAYTAFRKLRWPATGGEPVCPRCGSVKAYTITTRRKFKCAGCGYQYSVTSGTIFASRKMAFVDLLAAICIFVNGAKGLSALQFARDLDCQHKTAFVLCHKLREAMAAETKGLTLAGEVEVDGAHFGGHIRPENRVEDRVDRRLAEHQTGKRRVVIAIRQREGRTLPFVAKSEADGVDFMKRYVCRKATVHADEAAHWDVLHTTWTTKRINHSEAYSDGEGGGCTNQAESYFSRLRRMVAGQHHSVSPQHLHGYASHAAWLEDNRRTDNGGLTSRTLSLALAHGHSLTWRGYWQRGPRHA